MRGYNITNMTTQKTLRSNQMASKTASKMASKKSTSKTPAQPVTQPSKTLETFPNPAPHRDYHIHMQIPEFTCLCPKTGQPDFATFTLDYIADEKCVELKSLKLYMWSYRDEGAFHEAVTNRILDDLVSATKPRFMRLTAKWYVRGGIFTNVVVEHRKKGWKAATPVVLESFSKESNTRD
jgi:7-cyano-7-deazaguanine reductase